MINSKISNKASQDIINTFFSENMVAVLTHKQTVLLSMAICALDSQATAFTQKQHILLTITHLGPLHNIIMSKALHNYSEEENLNFQKDITM